MRRSRAFVRPLTAVFVLAALLVPTAEPPLPPHAAPATAAFEASQANVPSVWRAVVAARERLDVAVSLAESRTAKGVAGEISTAKLTELKAAVDDSVVAAGLPLPREEDRAESRLLLEPSLAPRVAWARISQIDAAADSRIGTIEVAVRGWVDELAAEKERIRKAAEEAARAAAAAAAARGSGAVSLRPGESLHARVARVAATLPFSVSFVISNDCGGARACYNVGASFVIVTEGAARMAECRIKRILAHEYRHTLQYLNGQIQVVGSDVANRAWLEADAQAFARGYGC